MQADENGSWIRSIDYKCFFICFATIPVTTFSGIKANIHTAQLYHMLDNGFNVILLTFLEIFFLIQARDLFLFNSTHPKVFKDGAIQGQIVDFSSLPELDSNLVSRLDKS